MPKLLMVTTVPTTLRAFLLPFAYHYRALGWQVDAAAQGIEELGVDNAAFNACHELPLSRNPLEITTLLKAPAAIRALVRMGEYDLVHVHTPIAAFLVRWSLRRHGWRPRVVYTAHGFHFHRNGSRFKNFFFRALECMAARWCDALIAINQEDYLAAQESRFATKLVYMPGIGVDTAVWSPGAVSLADTQAARTALGLDVEGVLFLMVAEFNAGKRHCDAVQALAGLRNTHVHLALAGVGREETAVHELVQSLGLERQVHFLGFRHDIPVLMRASRAVLLSSVREGLPRSLLEALSLAVPIIGADIRGIRELAEGGCGMLHAVGDVQALAVAMQYMVEYPEAALEMGRTGRMKVSAYDIREIIQQHDALYAELLAP